VSRKSAHLPLSTEYFAARAPGSPRGPGCDMFRQMRSHTFYQASRARSGPALPGATDFLRGNATMASLMPAVNRMMALQKDCAGALPAMFRNCDILQFEDGQLVLATPTSAVAAKLKQQLPKLQAELEKRGWQVHGIKLKVQVTKSIAPVVHTRQLLLPNMAVSAFDELSNSLPESKQNSALIAALRAMVQRRREPGG
jgi:hypothetical protein